MPHRLLRSSLVASLAALSTPAFAASVHVPADADTIAEALALVGDWDTIYVDAATYGGEAPVTIDFPVQIQSNDGSLVAYPQFVVNGATLRLSGGVIYGEEYLWVDVPTSIGAYAAVLVTDGTFEGHELEIVGVNGGGIYGVDASISLVDGWVGGGTWLPGVKVYGYYEGVSLTLRNVTLADNLGGAVHVYDANPTNYTTVAVEDCAFAYNTSTTHGADLALEYVDVATVDGSTFEGAYAAFSGGSIIASETNLAITDAAFAYNAAPQFGSIYATAYASTPTITIADSSFVGGWATDGSGPGGEIGGGGVDFVISGVEASDGVAAYGAFAYLTNATIRMHDVDVRGGWASLGGALFLSSGVEATLTDVRLCGNEAGYGGAIYATGALLYVEDSLLHANTSSYSAALEFDGGNLSLYDNTFAGNVGPRGAALVSSSTASIVNNLFVGSATGVSRSGSVAVPLAGYNLYYDLDTTDAGYSTEGGDLYVDPRFVPEFTPGLCGSLPRLSADSPAIDAGDPTRLDADGGPSDIGAFDFGDGDAPDTGDTGGPDDTGDTGLPDTGDSGLPDTGDTEDSGAGAADADGDGVPDGEDCAPDDPARYPGAYDDPTDSIDQDCDGDAATGLARGGCGCDHGPPAPAGLALLALLLLRRRRA